MGTTRPRVITDKEAMRIWSRDVRWQGKTIGFVPTMGSLHEGHLSLVRQSLKLTDVTVVSIYVNPGQFSPSEDLSTYPSDFPGDLAKLAAVPGGVDVVFYPRNLYDHGNDVKGGVIGNNRSDGGGSNGGVVSCLDGEGGLGLGHETWIRVERLEKGLCGKSRPVLFRGVATIVTKLFNIVEPNVAVFGKKDYQQWRIIQRMVRDLDFGIQIVGSEIVRETDGLAMSSRNVLLSPDERQRALAISRSLLSAKSSAMKGRTNCTELRNMIVQELVGAGGRVDYVEIVDQDTLVPVEDLRIPVVVCVAAWFGTVRLIDNIEINVFA